MTLMTNISRRTGHVFLPFLASDPISPIEHAPPAHPRIEHNPSRQPQKRTPQPSDPAEKSGEEDQSSAVESDHIVDDYA